MTFFFILNSNTNFFILKVCLHDGTCNVDENYSDGYNCDCMDEFTGRHCEHHALCENGGGCQNGATCRVDKDTSELRCDCMLGYIGDRCETGNVPRDSSALLLHNMLSLNVYSQL